MAYRAGRMGKRLYADPPVRSREHLTHSNTCRRCWLSLAEARMADLDAARDRMIDRQIVARGIADSRIQEAFRSVPATRVPFRGALRISPMQKICRRSKRIRRSPSLILSP